MNKVKFDERIENALNTFFENEPDRSRFELAYNGQVSALVGPDPEVSENVDKWSRLLREVFMFGPGAFGLFFMTLSVITFYPTLGLGFQGFMTFLFTAFLTFAGAGSIFKAKNLVVPGTVMGTAIVVAIGFSILSRFLGIDEGKLYFSYGLYLFPVVLVLAKLAQGSVAEK
ncbi:MAG: hypothetical protein WBO10_10415 [Pyrinomonadaceae bacterium]